MSLLPYRTIEGLLDLIGQSPSSSTEDIDRTFAVADIEVKRFEEARANNEFYIPLEGHIPAPIVESPGAVEYKAHMAELKPFRPAAGGQWPTLLRDSVPARS